MVIKIYQRSSEYPDGGEMSRLLDVLEVNRVDYPN